MNIVDSVKAVLINAGIGVFVALAIRALRDRKRLEQIAAGVLAFLVIALAPLTSPNVDWWLCYATSIGFLLICLLCFGKYSNKFSTMWQRYLAFEDRAGRLLEDGKQRLTSGDAEIQEDFMKTKQGKLLTALCILLTIYMIGSAFCIYRLNAKINSVYEITQDIKNDK